MNLQTGQLAPLALDGLIKDYGHGDKKLRAVNNVNLEMRPGEILGLLGPNGAGKTSIISILVTLEEATAGSARIFGMDVTAEPARTKRLTGFVPQELINHGYFSVKRSSSFTPAILDCAKTKSASNGSCRSFRSGIIATKK